MKVLFGLSQISTGVSVCLKTKTVVKLAVKLINDKRQHVECCHIHLTYLLFQVEHHAPVVNRSNASFDLRTASIVRVVISELAPPDWK